MKRQASIDLSCDMGESFGVWRRGDDQRLLDYVTSANVACGFHAGDANVMDATVKAAVARSVAIGAHPSYPDLAGFGRRHMRLAPADLERLIVYQVGALAAIAMANGAELKHVKAHGALYNDAASDEPTARAVARAVARFRPQPIFVGPNRSALQAAAEKAGLRFAAEAYCDRAYEKDGSLRERAKPGAVHTSADVAAAQAVDIALRRRVKCFGGQEIDIEADTICVHGDTPAALEMAAAVRRALAGAGLRVEEMLKT